MLVIVKNRNIHQFPEFFLDNEAFRCLDIFQINAAEGRTEITHGIDELLGIFGINFQINRIDVGEALKQNRFAFHNGFGRKSAEIA